MIMPNVQATEVAPDEALLKFLGLFDAEDNILLEMALEAVEDEQPSLPAENNQEDNARDR